MKTISRIVIGLFLVALVACEPSEPATEAYGDAFYITKVAGQDTVFGLALHAFANKNFQSVSAASGAASYDLSKNLYQNNFYYETPSASFGTSIPQDGEYTFSAVIEDSEAVSFVDDLTDDIIYPANVTKLEYNADDEQWDIEWDENDDVDIYGFTIVNADNDAVFVGNAISGDKTEYSITPDTYGWLDADEPKAGQTYTIYFEAFLYEASKTEMNIQCKSVYKQDVTWGE